MKTFDTTLMDLSSHISCSHMDTLAKNERDMYHLKYVNQFSHNQPKELYLDRMYQIPVDKKACIEKKTLYNSGDWMLQFDNIITEPVFNVQTKPK